VALRGLMHSGFAGVNVTVPHKEEALRVCDEVDAIARRCGAANTLTFTEDGRIFGSNTDAPGFTDNLRAAGVDLAAGAALVLGAGGSARAVCAALIEAGVAVTVTNRTAERAEALRAHLPEVAVLPWEQRADALAEAALLVNTTSLGWSGGNATEPTDGIDHLPIPLERAPAGLVVNDIVYNPLHTPLLVAAAKRGLRVVDGLGMLLHQARPGFHAWFGVDPEVDAAARALLEADLPRE
jgi:shikimate dehydrogenase